MSMTEKSERLPIKLIEYDKARESETTWDKLGLAQQKGLSEEDRALAEKLQNVVEIFELKERLYVKANSYVGHVAFSTFDLVIVPKFEQLAQKENKERRSDEDKKHSPLATLLTYAFDFQQLQTVGFQLSPEAFFAEILVHWLLEEVRNIQRRGLFQQYRKERRDLSVLRGKIDMKTFLRRGGIPSEMMPCVFYRRSLDNVLNQILCAALRRGAGIVKNPKLKRDCLFLADDFAMSVSEKSLDRKMLTDASRGLNRLNAHYTDAVRIIAILLEGSGGFVHGDRHEKQIRIPGFFFDMNMLFERVVAKFLKENLPQQYKMLDNVSEQVFSGFQNGVAISSQGKWKIKPDFVVEQKAADKRIVLDAKYIKIEPGKEEVLYQLCVYAMTFSTNGSSPIRKATIIFPDHFENENMEPWDVSMHRYDEDGKNAICTITIKPISMNKLVELIRNNEPQQRQDYALELIGEKKHDTN